LNCHKCSVLRACRQLSPGEVVVRMSPAVAIRR
ncbi:hypothetical protein A2U01_0110889, partial [Trifolium medium]|nr:hypothetical protein [Trifolium medium]